MKANKCAWYSSEFMCAVLRAGLGPLTICLSLLWLGGAAHGQVIAISGTATVTGNQWFAGNNFGTDFDVNLPITVTALGFFDADQDGLSSGTTIQAEIWSRDNGGTPNDPDDDTAGSLLATRVFDVSEPGTLNPSGTGVYRFLDLNESLELPIGSYTVTAAGFTADDLALNRGFDLENLPAPTLNGSNNVIQFVGTGRFGVAGAGSWPDIVDAGPATRFWSGSFIYDQPTIEPFLRVQIDRDDGNMSLVNATGAPVQILGYSITSPDENLNSDAWKSIAENYDADGPGPDTGTVDSNDNWTELTASGTYFDLSEFESDGGDGALIGSAQVVDLGSGVWGKSPNEEDVKFQYLLSNGTVVDGTVSFSGNGDVPFEFGDLNYDGTPFGLDDFVDEMLPHLVSDQSSLTIIEAYNAGDLDGDMDVDTDDFRIFKEGYLAAGGSATALAAALVPEPSSAVLFTFIGLAAMLARRRFSWNRFSVYAPVVALAFSVWTSSSASAQVIAISGTAPIASGSDVWFQYFNGNSFGADFDVHLPIHVSSLGFFDASQDGLSVGTTIQVEIWSRDNNGTLNNPYDDTGGSLLATRVFDSNNSGTLNPGGTGVYRFLDLNESLELPIGSYTVTAAGFTEEDPALNRAFDPANLPAPSVNESNNVIQFVGGGRYGFNEGAGIWPTTADFLGYPVRYFGSSFVYDFERLVLEVNTDTGKMHIRNQGADTFDVDVYQIQSLGGSLDKTNWTSLQDLGVTGWYEGGETNESALYEFNLATSSTFAPGANQSLGAGYNTSVNAKDLVFSYITPTGAEVIGTVDYTLLGDMNGDDVVNTDDVAPFIEALTNRASYDANYPEVDADEIGDIDGSGTFDFGDIKAFGELLNSASGSSSGETVPEPAAALLLLFGLVGILHSRTRPFHESTI